jgi:hypothetical protein
VRATDPGSVREEAERLVASVLAAASVAARDLGAPHKVATDDRECCVCPLCRVIAAVRDPDPEFAEKLATGVGDLAAAAANVLRTFSPPESEQDTWQTATRDAAPPPPPRRRPMAKKAVKPPAQEAPDDETGGGSERSESRSRERKDDSA